MATKTLMLGCAINEDGNAQNPTEGVSMRLDKPDGTVHTAWGAATQNESVGDGAYFRNFTINDESDPTGVYTAWFKTTTDGAKTPIGSYPVTVIL